MFPNNEMPEIPFDKRTEVREFGKFISQLVREGTVFKINFTNDKWIVIITGGF